MKPLAVKHKNHRRRLNCSWRRKALLSGDFTAQHITPLCPKIPIQLKIAMTRTISDVAHTQA